MASAQGLGPDGSMLRVAPLRCGSARRSEKRVGCPLVLSKAWKRAALPLALLVSLSCTGRARAPEPSTSGAKDSSSLPSAENDPGSGQAGAGPDEVTGDASAPAADAPPTVQAEQPWEPPELWDPDTAPPRERYGVTITLTNEQFWSLKEKGVIGVEILFVEEAIHFLPDGRVARFALINSTKTLRRLLQDAKRYGFEIKVHGGAK